MQVILLEIIGYFEYRGRELFIQTIYKCDDEKQHFRNVQFIAQNTKTKSF